MNSVKIVTYFWLVSNFVLSGINSEVISCKNGTRMSFDHSQGKKKQDTWKYLTFTTMWPEAFCLEREVLNDSCSVPEAVKNWTIHGLWPSTSPGEGPVLCNMSSAFNTSEIEDLIPQLEVHWVSFNPCMKYYEFWSYEWCKHGTCAGDQPSLKGQHAYFQTTLNLLQTYNPYNVLKKAGILPTDDKPYTIDAFYDAFMSALGVTPTLDCFISSVENKSYVLQVELCMDKTLKPMSCPSEIFRFFYDDCQDLVYYPLIGNHSLNKGN